MITIVTPTLNAEKFIEKNIRSISLLTVPYEHIVVDGGSSDGTLKILQQFPHVKVLQQLDKMGMYSAIHQGFQAAKYEFITWINSDDEIIANNIESTLMLMMKRHSNFVYGESYTIYSNLGLQVLRPNQPFSFFFLKHGLMPFTQSSTIYTKSLYNKAGCLEFKKYKLIGDLDMFQRMSINERFKPLKVKKPLSKFLYRDDSLLHSNKNQYMIELNTLTNKPTKFVVFLYRLTLYNFYIHYIIEFIKVRKRNVMLLK